MAPSLSWRQILNINKLWNQSSHVFELFFILAMAILTGFFATLIFERTRISQVIILILFGFLLGPVLHVVDVSPGSIIVSLLPFLATLALIVLLFDAGLMIDVFSVAKAVPRSTLFTFLVFAISVLLVAAFSFFVLGWPILHGVLLGAVLGGTSSAIVIAMVENAGIAKESRSLLTVESTITDALCLIVAGMVIQLIVSNQAPEIPGIINMFFSSFSISIVFGIISAIVWIFTIQKQSLAKYAYMLTLAMIFGLFAMTEAMKANGGISVFVFGMVLGNAKELGKLLRFRKEVAVNPNIRLFQEEITFFVRTFFFVYIGLLLSPAYFSPAVLAVSLALIALFVLSRWLVQKALLADLPAKDKKVIVSMLPRGLAAAVLATMPLSSGINIPDFQQIVFVALLFSNIAATFGIFLFDRESGKNPAPKPDETLERTRLKNRGKKPGRGDEGESAETEDDAS
jgi:cell volume regulation protein A